MESRDYFADFLIYAMISVIAVYSLFGCGKDEESESKNKFLTSVIDSLSSSILVINASNYEVEFSNVAKAFTDSQEK